MFKEVPYLEQVQRMIDSFNYKRKSSWLSNSILALTNEELANRTGSASSNRQYVKNITNFIETIRVLDIVGRRAHDVRYNLWYDSKLRILYSTGHAVVLLKLKSSVLSSRASATHHPPKPLALPLSGSRCIESKKFMHLMNGNGVEPS
jgi:hypothetical protein